MRAWLALIDGPGAPGGIRLRQPRWRLAGQDNGRHRHASANPGRPQPHARHRGGVATLDANKLLLTSQIPFGTGTGQVAPGSLVAAIQTTANGAVQAGASNSSPGGDVSFATAIVNGAKTGIPDDAAVDRHRHLVVRRHACGL